MTCKNCTYLDRLSTIFICTHLYKSIPDAYTEVLPLYKACEFFEKKG